MSIVRDFLKALTTTYDLHRRRSCVFGSAANDCGPASLAAICRYYGRSTSLFEVAELCPPGALGVTMESLRRAAEQLGFEAQEGVADLSRLATMPLPAVLRLDRERLGHFVTLYRVHKNGSAMVADPSLGFYEMSSAELFAKWKPAFILLLRPGPQFRRRKRERHIFGAFLALLLVDQRTLLLALLLAVVATCLAFTIPLFIRALIDYLIPAGQSSLIAMVSLCAMLLLLARTVSSFCRQGLLERLQRNVELSLVRNYVESILQAPSTALASYRVGELFNRLFEIESIVQNLSAAILSLVVDMMFAVGLSIFILWYDPVLTLTAMGSLPFMLLVALASSKKSLLHQRMSQQLQGDLMGKAVDTFVNARIIKACAVEDTATRTLCSAFEQVHAHYRTSERYSASITATISGLTGAFSLGLLSVGANLVIGHRATLGTLMFSSAILGMLLALVEKATPAYLAMQRAFAGYERVNSLLQSRKELFGELAVNPYDSGAAIRVRDLSYEFPGGKVALHSISFQIPKHGFVAVVGQTGCGKTTLACLLAGLDRSYSGSIWIGDADLKSLSKTAIHDSVSIVFQDAGLMSASVAYNVTMGDARYGQEDIERAAKLAKVDDFVESLPGGYDCPIGAAGVMISSGERQRIALARAFIRRPRILILDEATSNLDMVTEQEVLRNISSMSGIETIILITHRLSTARNADKIYVIAEGRLVEEGSHEVLMASGGWYADLWAGVVAPHDSARQAEATVA